MLAYLLTMLPDIAANSGAVCYDILTHTGNMLHTTAIQISDVCYDIAFRFNH